MLDRFRAWFTEKRRVAIYAAAASLAPALISFGILTESTASAALTITGAALSAAAGALALSRLSLREAGVWLQQGGRAAIYSGAALLVPALIAFGFLSGEQGAFGLSILSTVLTGLTGLVAIANLTPDDDETPAVA